MVIHSIAKKKPETILVGQDLYILWKDGHESHYKFWELRDLCPCAHCVDELSGEKKLDSQSIPKDIIIRRCEYVGNYALRIYWSDHHNSGLYTFKSLRTLCTCSYCSSSSAVNP